MFHIREFIKLKKNYQKPDYEKVFTILKKAKNIALKNDANFYLVYLPSYHRYQNSNKKYEVIKKKIKSISNELVIKFIDVDKEFNKVDPNIYFPRKGGHYNEKGYLVISELISRELN